MAWLILICIIGAVTLVLFAGLVLGTLVLLAVAGGVYQGASLLPAPNAAQMNAARLRLHAGIAAAALLLMWLRFVPRALPNFIQPPRASSAKLAPGNCRFRTPAPKNANRSAQSPPSQIQHRPHPASLKVF